MTSGNLFSKLVIKDIKRRIWCPVFLMIIYFLAMEVYTLMTFQRIEAPDTYYDTTCLKFFTNEFLSPQGYYNLVLLTCAAAVVCGLSSFSYLNNRKQIDLYHSLPVHRNTMFFSRYISGLLCFLVPFLGNLLITVIMASVRHAVNGATMTNAFGFMAYHIIYFTSIYTVVIVAVMLTGNLVLNVLGSAVLLFYSQIFWASYSTMNMTFYKTFAINFFEPYVLLSPVHDIISEIRKISDMRDASYLIEFTYQPIIKNMLFQIPAIFICIAAAFFLYQKRPSEAAGKSMTFPISEKIIKPLFLIPTSLLSGTFFMQASSDNNDFSWFLFGSVFGFFLIGLIMEIIFRQDFKQMFCHIKYSLGCFAALLLIIAVYKMDLTGFDKYIPKEEQIEYMAASIDDLDDGYFYSVDGYYYQTNKYRLSHMQMKDFSVVYKLSDLAIKNPLVDEELYTSMDVREAALAATKGIPANTSAELVSTVDGTDIRRVPITVLYHLKNGKDVYRSYYVNDHDAEVTQLLNDLYRQEDYKLGNFPLLTNEENKYVRISCSSMYAQMDINLTEEMNKEFLTIYKRELKGLTLEKIRTEYQLGSLNFWYKRKADAGNRYLESNDGYPIYPEFTDTIAWIKNQGFDLNTSLDDYHVKQIQVYDYNNDIVTEDGYTDFAYVNYEEPEQINKILPYLASDFNLGNSAYRPVDDSFEIDVMDENSNYQYFVFKKDSIPQFIYDDIAAYDPSTNSDSGKY